MDEKFEFLEDTDSYNEILDKGMFYADAIVNKNYLINLQNYPVLELPEEKKIDDNIRLFQIERIVYDKDEIANDKLISIYSALSNIQSSGLLVLKSTRASVSFYLGIRSEENASTAEVILKNSFNGNFPGSKVKTIEKQEIAKLLGNISETSRFGYQQNVASVSIVPSARDDDKLKYVQGIEKFIDTMKGEVYTAIFIADPLDKEMLELRKKGLLKLQTSLSPFVSMQLSYGQNYSKAVSKGMSENFSKSLNDSLTDTNSNFQSVNRSRNKGTSFGFLGIGFNHGSSTGYSSGNSWAQAVTKGTTETSGTTTTENETSTESDNRTITVTNENKSVKYIVDKIEQHLKRIKECESFGLWDVACYFVSENIQTSVVAASTYKALMAGNNSGVENSYVNIWSKENIEHTPKVLEYLRYCQNPYFLIPEDNDAFCVEEQSISACSLISGNEIPYIMGLPRKSVSGVTALHMAEFGRNVMTTNGVQKGKKIEFGSIYHMGTVERGRVKLDLESFRSHCFITGSTGSGKSNTTYKILDEMIKNGIPFLVVEPAKGEYKRYYGGLEGINVFCTNPKYFSMLKINPFKFNQGIHVLEHLDRLIEIFNACWPLYAAMPAILKESFELAYVKCGWDLNNSIHIPNSGPKFPTFEDVLITLPEIINSSEYSGESKGNYIGALVTRVRSLTNGILGQVMCDSSDIDDEVLFDQNTIVDLSRISSLETKSLLMGILILKLNEHRMCCSDENQPLRHVTVLEEAHNILKRTSGGGGMESADVQGKSVEMISASIAEMRTYGEGFIIVDQSPTAVDASAIKNTNTKVIMRLPDYDDSQIAGKAIGLNENQILEISRFPMGVAAVFQSNWIEAVLTKIDLSDDIYHIDNDEIVIGDYIANLKGRLATLLLIQFETGSATEYGFQTDELISEINDSELTEYKKSELITKIVDICTYFETETINNKNFSMQLSKLIGCDGLFNIVPIAFEGEYGRIEKITKDLITPNDATSIRKWFRSVFRHIDEYIYVDDESVKRKIIRYLIFNKRVETKLVNKYQLIYKYLYE